MHCTSQGFLAESWKYGWMHGDSHRFRGPEHGIRAYGPMVYGRLAISRRAPPPSPTPWLSMLNLTLQKVCVPPAVTLLLETEFAPGRIPNSVKLT